MKGRSFKMPKITNRVVVHKPFVEVIRELMKEGWQPSLIKGEELILQMEKRVSERAAKYREN